MMNSRSDKVHNSVSVCLVCLSVDKHPHLTSGLLSTFLFFLGVPEFVCLFHIPYLFFFFFSFVVDHSKVFFFSSLYSSLFSSWPLISFAREEGKREKTITSFSLFFFKKEESLKSLESFLLDSWSSSPPLLTSLAFLCPHGGPYGTKYEEELFARELTCISHT